MTEDDRDHLIDTLLETSLARYSRVEPRQGLEERLLAEVRGAQADTGKRRRWSWYLVPAAAAAATFLVLGGYLWRKGAVSPPAPEAAELVHAGLAPAAKAPVVSALPVPALHSPASPAAQSGMARRSSVDQAAATLPRPHRDLFPSPEPLSDQDRILLHWVQGDGSGLVQVLDKLPVADQPPGKIRIDALQIPLLTVEPIAIPALEPGK